MYIYIYTHVLKHVFYIHVHALRDFTENYGESLKSSLIQITKIKRRDGKIYDSSRFLAKSYQNSFHHFSTA